MATSADCSPATIGWAEEGDLLFTAKHFFNKTFSRPVFQSDATEKGAATDRRMKIGKSASAVHCSLQPLTRLLKSEQVRVYYHYLMAPAFLVNGALPANYNQEFSVVMV